MMPCRRLLGVLMLAIAIRPGVALAWGGEGHQVVALIAERHLTPAARAKIHELLGEDVNISDAEICNWADQIKRARLRTAPWHYVDIPLDAEGYDPKRDDPDGNHVIARVVKFESLLSNKDVPREARIEALKFLVHLIGDLHQPLHTAERNGDRGGNDCVVTFLGKKSDLRHVWDTWLLREYIGKTPIAEYADALDEQIGKGTRELWAKGKPAEWVTQSWIISRDVIYKTVPAEGAVLDADYVKRNRPIVEMQLQRAGVRLAEVLNRALAD